MDRGNNDDQSHHFAFFFQVGAQYGNTLAGILGTAADLFNAGDRNLSDGAASIGARFAAGTITPAQLGGVIRQEICKR